MNILYRIIDMLYDWKCARIRQQRLDACITTQLVLLEAKLMNRYNVSPGSIDVENRGDGHIFITGADLVSGSVVTCVNQTRNNYRRWAIRVHKGQVL